MSTILHSNCGGCEQGANLRQVSGDEMLYRFIGDEIAVMVGHTLFVDSTYGNDATGQRENMLKPFATAAAAEAAALAGDTIMFRPGLHTAANLGKNGVTYHLLEGAELRNVTNSTFIFNDSGKGAITLRVIGGKLSSYSTGCISRQNNGGVYLLLVPFYYKNTTGTFRELNENFNGRMIVNYNFMESYVYNWYLFLTQNAAALTTIRGNRVSSRTVVFKCFGGGRCHVNANYIYFNPSGFWDGVLNCSDNGAFLRARISLIETSSNSVNNYHTIMCETRSATAPQATVVFEGTIRHYLLTRIVIVEDHGIVELRNCRIERYNGNNRMVTFVNNANRNRIIMQNVEFVNYSVGAASEGIYTGSTSTPAGKYSVEANNVIIRLHSSSVALGAKAINRGAQALSLVALEDVRSNGSFDGTNLVTDTLLIVDQEMKSA